MINFWIGLVVIETSLNKADGAEKTAVGLMTHHQLTEILKNLTILMASVSPRGPPGLRGPAGRRGPRGFPGSCQCCCDQETNIKDPAYLQQQQQFGSGTNNKAKIGLCLKKNSKECNKRKLQNKSKKVAKELNGNILAGNGELVATKSNKRKKRNA